MVVVLVRLTLNETSQWQSRKKRAVAVRSPNIIAQGTASGNHAAGNARPWEGERW